MKTKPKKKKHKFDSKLSSNDKKYKVPCSYLLMKTPKYVKHLKKNQLSKSFTLHHNFNVMLKKIISHIYLDMF